jgi:hypothetical protein
MVKADRADSASITIRNKAKLHIFPHPKSLSLGERDFEWTLNGL